VLIFVTFKIHGDRIGDISNLVRTTPWRHVRDYSKASCILDLSTRWRLLVGFTSQRLHPGEEVPCTPWMGGCVGSGHRSGKKKNPCWESNLSRLARSQ
jgi:hypothetical protein